MGANVNFSLRIATVNQLIFLLLMYMNISDCSNSHYGCSPENGLVEALGYLIVFASLAILEGVMLFSLLLTIFDKSILKATQLNAFVFLVTLALCVYTILNWHYAHM